MFAEKPFQRGLVTTRTRIRAPEQVSHAQQRTYSSDPVGGNIATRDALDAGANLQGRDEITNDNLQRDISCEITSNGFFHM